MMKTKIALLLSLLMVLAALAGCVSVQTVEPTAAPAVTATQEPAPTEAAVVESTTFVFTDSVGRQVELPKNIEKIAVSGPLAQIAVFALAPDKLAGVASAWDESAKQYVDEKYYNLPELGQLYGGKGELNLETLLASGVQVVIDVGEPKD
nr:ABC transporter substrate-binding protein [Clostridia bacterium]